MTTLTEFLLARIAEDEEVARQASGSTVTGHAHNWIPAPSGDEWEVGEPRMGPETEVLVALRPGLERPPAVMEGHWGQVVYWDDGEGDELPIAHHIARHDPARVLAECEAKRRIIEFHLELESRVAAYRSSRWKDDMNDADILFWRKAEARLAATESVVRILAQVHSDHPSFDPTWKA